MDCPTGDCPTSPRRSSTSVREPSVRIRDYRHGVRDRDVIDDEWLAVRCQLGEDAAFDELVARWHRPLSIYARRIAGDTAADDLVQETWIRVVRGLPGLRDAARFRAWMFGIARRVMMDRLRQQYATPTLVPIDDIEPTATDAAALEAADDLEADLASLDEALERLPAAERELLVLFYLDELSLADLADVLGVPVGTVKSRLFRARRMAREALQGRKSR